MPPRKSTRSSTRSQRKPPVAVVDISEEEDEVEEKEEEDDDDEEQDSKNTRRSLRKPGLVVKSAERVTRSRTRASRNETPERNPPVDYDEGSDAEVEAPKRPRRRGKNTSRKPSPKNRRGKRTGRRASTSSKKKGRGGQRRSSKKDSEEEESDEEELDLGVSEEEAEEEEQDEDDYEEQEEEEGTKAKSKRALPPATPGSRRSNRKVRGRVAASPSSNKPSPAVVLERIESTPRGRPTRNRGGVQKKESGVTANPPERQSRRVRAGRQRGAKVVAVSEEEDREDEDEEEEETTPAKKGKEKKSNDKVATTEDIPNDEKENVESDSEEDMDVDEQVVKNTGRKNLQDEDELPASKKPRLDENAAGDVADVKVETASDANVSQPAKKIGEGAVQKEGDAEKTLPVVNGAAESTVDSVVKSSDSSELKNTTNDLSVVVQANGDKENSKDVISASLGMKVSRRCIVNPVGSVTSEGLAVVSYNMAVESWPARHQNLLEEISFLAPSILCFQSVDEAYFKGSLDAALKSRGYTGMYKAGKATSDGLATFHLLSSFEVLRHREFDVCDLLLKDLDDANLSDEARTAAKSLIKCTAPVQVVKLKVLSNGKCITVANVHMPSEEDDAVVALQLDSVFREVLATSSVAADPHVLCGVICLTDGSFTQQLLKDGCIKGDRLEELKKTAMVPVPNGEKTSLVSLLGRNFSHTSLSFKNSYESVSGHELRISDKNNSQPSRDGVWFSGSSLRVTSVLDVSPPSKETPLQQNIPVSLKVDLSFID